MVLIKVIESAIGYKDTKMQALFLVLYSRSNIVYLVLLVFFYNSACTFRIINYSPLVAVFIRKTGTA